MNIKRVKGNRQGKSPKLLKDKGYQQALEALFTDGARMAGADAVGVSKILTQSGIRSVMVGGLVVGCHSGRPRATQDIDVIVDVLEIPKKVIDQLGVLVGSKKLEKHPSFISFMKKTVLGDREVLDIITSKAGSYGLVFDNCVKLSISGNDIYIPSAEMMIVLKYTAAVNPIRQKAKQAQDWADIYSILDANEKINMYSITYLADLVVPGWGDDLENKIRSHRK
jgi:hypothetical protein